MRWRLFFNNLTFGLSALSTLIAVVYVFNCDWWNGVYALALGILLASMNSALD